MREVLSREEAPVAERKSFVDTTSDGRYESSEVIVAVEPVVFTNHLHQWDRPKTSRGGTGSSAQSSALPAKTNVMLEALEETEEGVSSKSMEEDVRTEEIASSFQTSEDSLQRLIAKGFVSSICASVVESLVAMYTFADYSSPENEIYLQTARFSQNTNSQSLEEEILSSRSVRRLQAESGRVHPIFHHISEWRTYPQTPINITTNRKLRRKIANEYDAQMLMHPSLFGFTLRWGGARNDVVTESRYIHPIFAGYGLQRRRGDDRLSSQKGN